MLPAQLIPESFDRYPAEARRIAAASVPLLRRLPLGFLPLLLRELIVYDWKFPAERRELDGQFSYLQSLSPAHLGQSMAKFSGLRLALDLEKLDWVNAPALFTEQLTAHLWTTHQIDLFRASAVEYMAKATAASETEPLPTHRLGLIAIGQGVEKNEYRLFRKLRPHGTCYTNVKIGAGIATLAAAVAKRCAAHPLPYGHWYIDGASPASGVPDSAARISYAGLASARAVLQARMQQIYENGQFDPEAFRTRMAQMQPADIGLASGDGVLTRFQLSLLTEGSGTQVFATTFVQWAAREALRRAQPLTLFARFAPRQRENPMNVLLAEARRAPELDPQGSLVDADMGAYYTWLNMQRLTGANGAAFLVWFEGQQDAIAIGPGIDRDRQSDAAVELEVLVAGLA